MTEEFEAQLVVSGMLELADDVVEVSITREDHSPLPSWQPGAHIEFTLGNGLVRQYSLLGDPGEVETWRVGVLRERNGRGGSEYIHTRLRTGDRIRVRGPRNNFAFAPSPRYLFIAGGIGITPLIAMIAEAAAAGADWRLLYGGRTRSTMAMREHLALYGDRVLFWPQDEYGLLDLAAELSEPRESTAVYCCGPEPLIAAVESLSAGWPEGALHVERFKPRADLERHDDGATFTVELRRSGLSVRVPPDKSILEVVCSAGVDVLSSCEDGICGTCQTAVLEGRPDHRDSVLSKHERERGTTMMLCVSRSLTPSLTLDL